jgi:hypothetical protein
MRMALPPMRDPLATWPGPDMSMSIGHARSQRGGAMRVILDG